MKTRHIISFCFLWTCLPGLFGQEARLGAGGDFDPANPGDPQVPVLKHSIGLAASPADGGTFNISSDLRIAEGDSVHLYAYPRTGFVFRGWMLGDSLLSKSSPYYYKMKTEDARLTALFEYAPENPANPGRNFYDAATGEVIVDDFTPGNLSSAIYEATLGHESEEGDHVTQITVSGKIDSYDFGIANNYPACTLVDLSRTYGYNRIPSYCYYGNTNLVSIILPPGLETIEHGAFYDCTSLTDISCYALVPPALEEEAFTGIAEGAVLHVPAAAIPLYAEAEGWKDFTILPLQEEVRSLEVSLPADAADGRYKDMTLELVNAETGQRQRYVISDRVVYTFNSLMKNSTFHLYVKNQSGTELGRLENVAIEEENVKVAFAELLQPQDVSLSVLLPDGTDITGQTTVTWLGEGSNFLKQGAALSGQTAGTFLTYRIVLPQTLAMEFAEPSAASYTVTEGDNRIVCTLDSLAKQTVTGLVKDITTGQPIGGAAVSISQVLNGKYSKSFTAKTGTDGRFSQQVFGAPTSIAVSAADYVSLAIDSAVMDSTGSVGELALRAITGVTITTSLTYTGSVAEGDTAETSGWYEDYANVAYTIYNVTQGKPITDFSAQYPQIVLLEEVAPGDRLRLTASSKTGAFVPVEAETVVDSTNRASATFPIVALGGIRASFTSTDNAAVAGILYDANGQLVKKYNYTNAQLSISSLADGQYLLVTMASSSLFNSILNLSEFAASGLTEGADYVVDSVTVRSGVISLVANEQVPALDESKLYYTGESTMFTVNKSSIVAGNYLTLKGRIDFKDEYAAQVGNVSMVVDLPESCSFVENSVMVGTRISGYTIDGQRLTIPLDNYRDEVRFCVIPTAGGSYAPSAFAHFTLDGSEVQQPIGSANYEVKDLSIIVPSTVAKTTIPVSGTAIGKSTIQIYDNGVLIGQTTALANGIWNTTCELEDPYNLSRHSIYAKVITHEGVELQSETQECMYDMGAIQVSKVIMYHDNPEMGKTYEVVFNFLNPTTEAQQYTYYIYNKQFTFTIDFTNNDTSLISNVVLYVKTGSGRQIPLKASYDARKQKWVANGEFGNMYDGDIPVNVSVDFDSKSDYAGDTRYITNAQKTYSDISSIYQEGSRKLEDVSEEKEIISIYNELGIPYEILELDTLSYANYLDQLSIAELEALANDTVTIDTIALQKTDDFLTSIGTFFEQPSTDITFVTEEGYVYEAKSCDNITKKTLIEQGFDSIPTTEGNFIYFLQTNNKSVYVNFQQNQYISIEIPSTFSAQFKAAPEEDGLQRILNLHNNIQAALDKVRDAYGVLEDRIGDLYNELDQELNGLNEQVKANTKKWQESHAFERKLQQQIASGQLTDTEIEQAKRSIELQQRRQAQLNSAIKELNRQRRLVPLARACVKTLMPAMEKLIPIYRYFSLANEGISLVQDYAEHYNEIPSNEECKCDNPAWVRAIAITNATVVVSTLTIKLGVEAVLDIGVASGVIGSPLTGGASLGAAFVTALTKMAAGIVLDCAYERMKTDRMAELEAAIAKLKAACNDCEKPNPDPDHNPNPDGNNGDDNNNGNSGAHPSGSADADPAIDPSGYVYEAVSSNRLEGVTATCYYKETVEDMYGDLHENVVLWDAAEYAQENPLFTDENGMYRWDVPQGLWQVKFEKEGYQTTYSDWLPVPPPQLEVNIAMTQSRQPEVQTARAYEDGIEVEFDKYMLPETMTTDNLFASVGGEKVEGSIALLNEEKAYEGEGASYVSKVRFIPSSPFLATDEVTLTVSRQVKSYAGIQMESDYTQAFDIEKEVKSLAVDSVMRVPYTGQQTITVSALPYDAAIGKQVVVKSSSPMIVSLSADTLTLDESGQARLTLNGELPGMAAVTFALQGTGVEARSNVQVLTEESLYTPAPIASRASGTAVYRNTEIELSCAASDAVIYYTTDGSCPCIDSTRLVYEGPIAITGDVTIKAIAVATGLYESEVAEFSYTIKQTTLGLDLNEGWNWISHNLESPVATAVIGENAVRIVGQTEELVDDPAYGLTGNLSELNPTQAYKIQVSAATRHTLNGYEYNPATPFEVKTGWNWIGYPVSQTLSVAEAFASSTPDEEDYIVGQAGFAQYADGQWTGTLQTLVPGSGYLYFSKSDKQLAYNSAIVSRAQALHAPGLPTPAPWAVNRYRYPNVMCLVADVFVEGAKASAGDYSVGAFCGTECRGIGTYIDGKLMMNIYGEGGEKISFVAVDNATETTYTIRESEPFAETLLGSIRMPYSLTIGGNGTTGLDNRAGNAWKVWLAEDGSRLFLASGSGKAVQVSITDMGGNTVLTAGDAAAGSFIDVAHLPEGVYIVTLFDGTDWYYQKIVKSN